LVATRVLVVRVEPTVREASDKAGRLMVDAVKVLAVIFVATIVLVVMVEPTVREASDKAGSDRVDAESVETVRVDPRSVEKVPLLTLKVLAERLAICPLTEDSVLVDNVVVLMDRCCAVEEYMVLLLRFPSCALTEDNVLVEKLMVEQSCADSVFVLMLRMAPLMADKVLAVSVDTPMLYAVRDDRVAL